MMAMHFPEPDDNANEVDVVRILEEVKQVPSALRQQLINQVVDTVGIAHLETVTPTRKKVAEANEKFMMKIRSGMMVSPLQNVLLFCKINILFGKRFLPFNNI